MRLGRPSRLCRRPPQGHERRDRSAAGRDRARGRRLRGGRLEAGPAHAGPGFHRLSSHGIGGGTTEMQRNAIAERLLGLPREPSNDREVPVQPVAPEHHTPPGLSPGRRAVLSPRRKCRGRDGRDRPSRLRVDRVPDRTSRRPANWIVATARGRGAGPRSLRWRAGLPGPVRGGVAVLAVRIWLRKRAEPSAVGGRVERVGAASLPGQQPGTEPGVSEDSIWWLSGTFAGLEPRTALTWKVTVAACEVGAEQLLDQLSPINCTELPLPDQRDLRI